MGDTLISPNEHVVSTEFDGGEGVLVDLRTKKYFQLNETGMLIWRGLENGKTPSAIISELTVAYEVTTDAANSSFERFVSSLKANRLVQ